MQRRCVQLRPNETHHEAYEAVLKCQAKLAELAEQGWQSVTSNIDKSSSCSVWGVSLSGDLRNFAVDVVDRTIFINLAQDDDNTILKETRHATHVVSDIWAAQTQLHVQLRSSTRSFAGIWSAQMNKANMIAASSKYVLACGRGQPHGLLWRCDGAKTINVDICTLGPMFHGAISPNSAFIAYSAHNKVRYALLQNMQAIDLRRADDRIAPNHLRISADSSLVAAFSDQLIEIWDLNRSRTAMVCRIGNGGPPLYEDIKDATFSPDPQALKVLVGTTAGKLYFINCSTGTIEREIILDDFINAVAWSSDGGFIIVGGRTGYRILNMFQNDTERARGTKPLKYNTQTIGRKRRKITKSY